MHFTVLASLSLLGVATAFKDSVEAQIVTKQVQTVNGTVEYRTVCKTCPYTLCPHLEAPWGGDVYSLTCWTYGDRVGDSQLWLKTTTGCYLSEYDLVEYAGDFREDLASCGQVPYEVTEQPAQIRYLTECKWGYSTSAESITYYGRDLDLTLLCWAEGGTVYGDSYWYKTTDNCCVSGSGLWETPDRSQLDNCGPAFGPRINESVEPPELPGDKKPTPLPIEEESAAAPAPEGSSVARRWLQPEQIGEEYSYCRTCPSSASGSNCRVVKVYEYNQTVVSQCTLGNDEGRWMLTTDWCYVNGTDFWEPPWDQ
ncbi:hypothetical protein SAPIO_CDS4710 [Scedosporium apiospermum]|uniref:Cyanovirin-N domain-containing protein n=1 Tax=Pseudallescheria apiosperma TaxID=563466 RepID=A0A084G7G2_PSEDA|nr:uncharacterized protein SAPIO_CDS4710 [Scedosporium apiospermum]KEZ43274.1 hypothetical protein SAPIO_CDS4710 [Scedosporium apiospermum]